MTAKAKAALEELARRANVKRRTSDDSRGNRVIGSSGHPVDRRTAEAQKGGTEDEDRVIGSSGHLVNGGTAEVQKLGIEGLDKRAGVGVLRCAQDDTQKSKVVKIPVGPDAVARRRCAVVRANGKPCGRMVQGRGRTCELHRRWEETYVYRQFGARYPDCAQGIQELLALTSSLTLSGHTTPREAMAVVQACKMLVKLQWTAHEDGGSGDRVIG